jgi:hypothetical protein
MELVRILHLPLRVGDLVDLLDKIGLFLFGDEVGNVLDGFGCLNAKNRRY